MLVNVFGLLEMFAMDINLEIILIAVISVFLIVVIAVASILRKDGKITPIEAIMDARGLNRNKKSFGTNIFGQNIAFSSFLQVVNSSVKGSYILKSDKWDIELSSENKEFKHEDINSIKAVNGVEEIYGFRWKIYRPLWGDR